jgi:hypothetical protein
MSSEEDIFILVGTLPAGTIIPKPTAKGLFRVKGQGKRRGQSALIYSIPNRRNSDASYEKGINEGEWRKAYSELLGTGHFTADWAKQNIPDCIREGYCNFTTIGGVFCLLGFARYEGRGTYSAI